jgi:hypothetical protein
VRLDAVAPGQPALVHSVLHQLGQGVGHPLLMAPLVIRPEALSQRFERGLERRPAFRVEDGVNTKHPISHLADVEAAPGEVGLRIVEEAIRVGDMPGDATKVAQAADRIIAGVLQHLLFVE